MLKRVLDALAALLTIIYCAFFLWSEYQFMAKNGSVPSRVLHPNIVFFAGAYLGNGALAADRCREIPGAPDVPTGRKRPVSGFHVIGLFLLLGLLGVPLAVSMGLSAVTYIVVAGIPLATIAHRMGTPSTRSRSWQWSCSSSSGAC